ncbi:hypothetical protein [Lysobacter gummosus]|uniref:hypothetical protein n=1 Tax=Lysobacter gummosus TaxID=262324 RepID=UPI003641A455
MPPLKRGRRSRSGRGGFAFDFAVAVARTNAPAARRRPPKRTPEKSRWLFD